MALLSINEEELDRFIAKRVREGVREELAKRGEIISGGTIDNAVRSGLLDPTLPFPDGNKYYLREDLNHFAERGKNYLKKARL